MSDTSAAPEPQRPASTPDHPAPSQAPATPPGPTQYGAIPPAPSGSRRRPAVVAASALALAIPPVAAFAYVGHSVHPATVTAELPPPRAAGVGDADPGQGLGPDAGQQGDGSAGAGGSSRRGTLPYGQGRSRGGTSGATAGSAVSSAPGVLLIDGTVPGSVTGGNGGTSAGTGMVLSADGYALTNYHVVESTDKLRVTVADTGKSYAATVVGADATHDVALLRLQDATDLTPVTIDRDDVSVGQAVTAIGNGGGQDRLYQASGTVQQLDDDITVSADATSSGHQLNGLIRTNAGVVPGYSGGPLFDKQGEVMGINTAASSGGAPEGFAIPIQQALTIADQIKAGKTNGTVRVGPRAVLGVQVASSPRAGTSNLPGRGRVPQQSSGSQGGQDAPGAQDAPGSGSAGAAGSATGAAVTGVTDGSAAESAGLTAGATITAVDGTPIADAAALQAAISAHAVGDTVEVTWIDESGERHTAKATLKASPLN